VLDGRLLELGPTALALLTVMAGAAGSVIPREQLLAALPGATDAHAVEVSVARLRACLPDPALVRTVVKRGYQLQVAS
jgi:uroporphyrinogen-III synthase